MPRRQAPLQVNRFVGGLNTEFNPLEEAPDATSDEVNMEMGTDGSRFRRPGFLYEENYSILDSDIAGNDSLNLARRLFKWENAGGVPSKYLQVVQVANYIAIFDPDLNDSISDGLIYSETLSSDIYNKNVDFAIIDGLLINVTGEKPVKIYEYDATSGTVSSEEYTLKIRDLFGVEATVGGVTLTAQDNINVRPTSSNSQHIYNLRNQTFGHPRRLQTVEGVDDPIQAFVNTSSNTSNKFPSNADNVNRYFYPDSNDTDNRLVERYFAANMYTDPPGVSEAPKGFFVIDALERGASRLSKVSALEDEHSTLYYEVSSLVTDKTPGGPSVVGQYAGRIWYGGFSGKVEDGDSKSPRMSSYLLFSRLIRDKSELGLCYQAADPTSNVDPDVVDTDGGFLRIDGAYGIKSLITIDNALFVCASNGVWRVTGSEGGAFTATSYQVEKITNKGCVSSGSVVQVGKTLFYWGFDAIYYLSQNELGVWNSQDITSQKIKTFYSQISSIEKERADGYFDSLERKVRWVYLDRPNTATESKELVLNVDFGAFTYNSMPVASGNLPLVVSVGETNPYSTTTNTLNVTADGEIVTENGETVTANVTQEVSVVKEVIYLVISEVTPSIRFSFGTTRSTNFLDWTDTDYDAYLVVSSATGGEARYKKQVPYLNTFFKRTEQGFDTDLSVLNGSSCLLSARWNWTSNNNTNKWSTPRQAYRIGNLYFPDDEEDSYDTGEEIITTRNKIRGIGHSVAFKFEAETGKNMHIYGWSFDLQANAKE